MKKKLIFNLIASLLIIIIAGAVVITYAWYTNTTKSSSMKYLSNGLVISYRIEDEFNVEEYDVENVVFFDIDKNREGKYFSVSAVKVTLEISNYSSTPVTVSLKQDIQPFTLSNEIDNNVMTIYKYNLANINRSSVFEENTYYTFDNNLGYILQDRYEAGNTYFTKESYITATLTAENNKIISVSSVDSENNELVSTVGDDGKDFIVGKYSLATNLTKDAFNNGVYYNKVGDDYIQAKSFNSSNTYYEVNTMAYVGDINSTEDTVIDASITTTGAYISCAITDQNLDSSSTPYSVRDYLGNLDISNEFDIESPLVASSAYNTAGGSKTVYLYIYGVQLFNKSTSNFLENSRNIYPFNLIITANQI